jgi:hypothetical protein
MRANDNHRLGSGTRLKATDARNLHMPIKAALRKKDKTAKSLHELLKWIGNLNPGLHTKQQMVLDKQPELKDQWFVLLTE